MTPPLPVIDVLPSGLASWGWYSGWLTDWLTWNQSDWVVFFFQSGKWPTLLPRNILKMASIYSWHSGFGVDKIFLPERFHQKNSINYMSKKQITRIPPCGFLNCLNCLSTALPPRRKRSFDELNFLVNGRSVDKGGGGTCFVFSLDVFPFNLSVQALLLVFVKGEIFHSK